MFGAGTEYDIPDEGNNIKNNIPAVDAEGFEVFQLWFISVLDK